MTPVLVEVSGGIARLRFNRPEALNALDPSMSRAFVAAVRQVLADPACRVVVLSGQGRGFVAGGDLAAFRAAPDKAALALEIIPDFNAALLALAQAPQPVLALLHGPVAGAGLSIAAMADLAVAADDATFTMAYPRVGVPPDCGGSWALPRLLGLRKAMELALLSPTLDAAEAQRIGLVNRVVAGDALDSEGLAIARRLADAAPLAQARTKALIRAGWSAALEDQLQAEQDAFAACAATEDFTEALDAFFAKRRPVFTGR